MSKENYLTEQGWPTTEADLNHLNNRIKPKLTKLLDNVRLPRGANRQCIQRELALIEREIIGLRASLRLRNGH